MILFSNPITLTVLEVSSAVPIAVAKAVVFSFTMVRSDEPPPPPPPPATAPRRSILFDRSQKIANGVSS